MYQLSGFFLVSRVRFFTLAHFILSLLSILRLLKKPSMCRVSSTGQQSSMAFSPLLVRSQSYNSKVCNLCITGIDPSIGSFSNSSGLHSRSNLEAYNRTSFFKWGQTWQTDWSMFSSQSMTYLKSISRSSRRVSFSSTLTKSSPEW